MDSRLTAMLMGFFLGASAGGHSAQGFTREVGKKIVYFLSFFPDKFTRNSYKVVFLNWEVSEEKFGICNDGLQPEICIAGKEPSLSISDLPSSSSSQ